MEGAEVQGSVCRVCPSGRFRRTIKQMFTEEPSPWESQKTSARFNFIILILEVRLMMYAKASSDATAKHTKCINNANIMQNQSRKKCTENAKNMSPKDALECNKKRKKTPTHLSTKQMQKAQNQCKTNAKKAQQMQQKCTNNAKTNAIKKQNKCDQKRSGLCLCIIFALYLCFFGDVFCIVCAFP